MRLLDYGVGAQAARERAGDATCTTQPATAEEPAVNVIVEREKGLIQLEQRIDELKSQAAQQPVDMSAEIRALEAKYAQIQRDIFGRMTPWQRVNMARHPKRPLGSDYLDALDQFDELHGDRHFRDDHAIVGGFREARGPPRHGDRPRQRPRYEGKGPPQLRHADAPEGLPQGHSAGAARRRTWGSR